MKQIMITDQEDKVYPVKITKDDFTEKEIKEITGMSAETFKEGKGLSPGLAGVSSDSTYTYHFELNGFSSVDDEVVFWYVFTKKDLV